MPKKIQIVTLTMLALLGLLFAACGDAKGSDSSANGNEGPDVFNDFGGEDELFVSAATEVLGKSANQFEDEISSMAGELEMHINVAGEGEISVTGEFAFQTPDAMYMSMEMDGDDGSGVDIGEFGSFDMLVRDNTMYMKNAFFGPKWIELPFDELGEDTADLDGMLNDGAPFDYSTMVDEIEGIEFVGEETIDGRDLVHYRLSMDAADAVSAFADTIDSSTNGVTDAYTDISGPINMDIWLGKSDFLPYLLTMDMNLDSPEGGMSMAMTMRITAYNGNVDIPEAPDDTVSMEDALGGLFGDFTDEDLWSDFTDED